MGSKKKRRWHSAQHAPAVERSAEEAPKRKCSVTSRKAKTLEQLLRELQHRDATPEDYELLLQLDESVKKKSLTQEQIDALPEVRLEELLQVVEAKNGEVDSICLICREEFLNGAEPAGMDLSLDLTSVDLNIDLNSVN